MDNNIKQNDWVAINLLNTDVTIDKLAADGINSLNTSIRPKEDYLQSDKVKEFSKMIVENLMKLYLINFMQKHYRIILVFQP